MSNFIERVTNSLKNEISELADNRCLFLRNPSTDFSRNRKIDFKTFIGITMNSGGCTMGKELLDYFNFDTNTPLFQHTRSSERRYYPRHLSICLNHLLQPTTEILTTIVDLN